jgi:heme o synthase
MEMQIQESKINIRSRGSLKDYLDVIKPRETSLLVFIAAITALVAADGALSTGLFLLMLATVLLASAGANGITNYLDRNIDVLMQRTRHRALPSGRIYPPARALVFTGFLSAAGLILAWYLHPYVFLADLIGTMAAVIYRKRVTCVFPQGAIASCAPVAMGWLAIKPYFDWQLVLLCILIALWLPAHIWSIMMFHKDDYIRGGINYFPVSCSIKTAARILMAFCAMLVGASLSLYFAGHFGLFYLVAASLLGVMIIYASSRLLFSNNVQHAWKLYKLSAFPYLGLIFLSIALDIWIR